LENLDLLSNDLQVTPLAQSYLAESARWAKFLAIMGFILCGIMTIIAFFMPVFLTQLPPSPAMPSGLTAAMKTGMTIGYVLFALLLFFPCLYLYKFSGKMQYAVKAVNQESFDQSLMNLKSMFKFYGVFTIIIISFYALAFIVAVAGALLR
jgi:Family of unknown function (DUF5362)